MNTSKAVNDIMKNEGCAKQFRLAMQVRGVAATFKSRMEESRFQASCVKHLWLLWKKPTDTPVSKALGVILRGLPTGTTSSKKMSLEDAKNIGLHKDKWCIMLKTLIKLACWMHYFGMQHTTLYMIFMARMDTALLVMSKKYPFSLHKKLRFSLCVESMVRRKVPMSLVVWNIDSSLSVYPELKTLLSVWCYCASNTECLYLFDSLPKSIRTCAVVLLCFSDLAKRNSIQLTERQVLSYHSTQNYLMG